MQMVHEFNIPIEEYAKRGKDNEFPVINSCPICKAVTVLRKNGFYKRYAILSKRDLRIHVRRLKCSCCRKTLSVLPSFLLPHYQHPVTLILECLKGYFLLGKLKSYYQKIQFYRRRFLKNIKLIEAFFRDQGYREVIPQRVKEKAIKLLKMIETLASPQTFTQRFFNHFQRSFMAT